MAKLGRKAAEKASQQRSRKTGLAVVIVLGVALFVGIAAAVQLNVFGGVGTRDEFLSQPCAGRGPTGSTHDHVGFSVILEGQQFNFVPPNDPSRYHLRAEYVHLEGGDGATIHVHATDLKLACFFSTLGWTIDDEAIETDTDETYSANDTHEIVFSGTDRTGEAITKSDWWNLIIEDGMTVRLSYQAKA